MRPIQQQDCPLCLAPAEYQLIDYDERKYFRCKNCVEFVISRPAEKRLAESIPRWRTQFSEQAKKSDDERILHITIPPVQKQEELAIRRFKAKWSPAPCFLYKARNHVLLPPQRNS